MTETSAPQISATETENPSQVSDMICYEFASCYLDSWILSIPKPARTRKTHKIHELLIKCSHNIQNTNISAFTSTKLNIKQIFSILNKFWNLNSSNFPQKTANKPS